MMKTLLIGLILLTSVSTFASTNYLCKTQRGIVRAVLLVEDTEVEASYRLYDLYKSVVAPEADYLNRYSDDYTQISNYFGSDDNLYSVKHTGSGTEMYTTVPRRFLRSKEVTNFLITEDLNGMGGSCSSGVLRGNSCYTDEYDCEVISSEEVDEYLELGN